MRRVTEEACFRRLIQRPLTREERIRLYSHCTSNQKMLAKEKKCGCFFCGHVFDPKEIYSWIEDRNGPTAVCPHCGIDSVIGEGAGFPLTKVVLNRLHEACF